MIGTYEQCRTEEVERLALAYGDIGVADGHHKLAAPTQTFPPSAKHFNAVLLTDEWVPQAERQPGLIIHRDPLLPRVGSVR